MKGGEGVAEISEYYDEHSELVYRYLFKLCGNAELAEELTQETFYQAIRTQGRFRGECKPSVWLCQIARHCWYKYLEKNKKSKSNIPVDEQLADVEAKPDEKIADAEDKMRIFAKMQELKEDYREVLYLRILGELSFKEIGMIMKKSENWARVTYFRAKNDLREKCR